MALGLMLVLNPASCSLDSVEVDPLPQDGIVAERAPEIVILVLVHHLTDSKELSEVLQMRLKTHIVDLVRNGRVLFPISVQHIQELGASF